MTKLALILTALAGSAAFAQQPPAAAPADHSSRGLDPNQIVCRSEPEPGSRLMGHRRCLTRAQWAERVRLDRQYAEKAQTTRTFCGGICVRRRGHGF